MEHSCFVTGLKVTAVFSSNKVYGKGLPWAHGRKKFFFNLNTVNVFHSFIKCCYNLYQGVATKYLNRYNALFAATYNNADVLVKQLCQILMNVVNTDRYHSNRDFQEMGLLVI